MGQRSVQEVIAERAPAWMATRGIVGVYEGCDDDGLPIIVVMTRADDGGRQPELPESADGYRIVREEADDLRPMGPSGEDQGK